MPALRQGIAKMRAFRNFFPLTASEVELKNSRLNGDEYIYSSPFKVLIFLDSAVGVTAGGGEEHSELCNEPTTACHSNRADQEKSEQMQESICNAVISKKQMRALQYVPIFQARRAN